MHEYNCFLPHTKKFVFVLFYFFYLLILLYITIDTDMNNLLSINQHLLSMLLTHMSILSDRYVSDPRSKGLRRCPGCRHGYYQCRRWPLWYWGQKRILHLSVPLSLHLFFLPLLQFLSGRGNLKRMSKRVNRNMELKKAEKDQFQAVLKPGSFALTSLFNCTQTHIHTHTNTHTYVHSPKFTACVCVFRFIPVPSHMICLHVYISQRQ